MIVRVRLPLLVRRSRTGILYFFYWAPFIITYQVVNRWPLLQPRELSCSWLDQSIPFVPVLLPLYVAYLPLCWWTARRLESDREVNRFFYGMHLEFLLSLPFFVLFPVTMPRARFYGAQAYNWADSFWRWFDAPNNCFPSLHVAVSLLVVQFSWRRPYRWLFTVLALGVAVSTVLVKQHYVVDVGAGIVVYSIARWLLAHAEIGGATSDGKVGDAAPFGAHGRLPVLGFRDVGSGHAAAADDQPSALRFLPGTDGTVVPRRGELAWTMEQSQDLRRRNA